MFNRFVKYAFLSLLCCLCCSVRAATFSFDDSDPNNHLWSSPYNWTGGVVPVAPIEHVYLANGTCLVDSDVDVTLESKKHFYCGNIMDNDANMIVDGGVLNAPSGYLMIGYKLGTNCYFELDSGSVTCTGAEGFGVGWEGIGTAVINGGSLECTRISIPKKSTNPGGNSLAIHGGTVTATSYCILGYGDTEGGNNSLLMDGGQLIINEFLYMSYDDSTVTVQDDGQLQVNGEIRAGRYADGIGDIVINDDAQVYCGSDVTIGYAVGGAGSLTMTGGEFTVAQNLIISNDGSEGYCNVSGGALDCNGDLVLRQKNSVTISGGVCKFGGITTSAALDPNILMNITGGVVLCKGDDRIHLAEMLEGGYIAGFGVPGAIRLEFDASAGSDGLTSLIPDLAVPNKAKKPSPGTGETIPLEAYDSTVLTWVAGSGAASHNVYFGKSFDAVNTANISSPEYKGNYGLGFESYNPGNLERDRVYYWRVDEVLSDSSVAKGVVWAFYVSNYYEIDDIEGYAADPNLLATIWTGAGADITVEDRYGYEGNYSLRVLTTADNASATWNPAGTVSFQEYMDLGIEALMLHFVGGVEHLPEGETNQQQVWTITLTDGSGNSATMTYTDPVTITLIDKWYAWVIDLDDFSGVDMSAIDSMTIVLEYDNTLALFDRIRLVGMDCDTSLSPEVDLNNDCVVNLEDFYILAGDWLDEVLDRGVDKTPEYKY